MASITLTPTRPISLRRDRKQTLQTGTVVTPSPGTLTARPAGTVLAGEGRPVTQVLIVETGRVIGVRRRHDGEMTSFVGGPGTVIGAADFAGTGRHQWEIRATSDVTLTAHTPNTYIPTTA